MNPSNSPSFRLNSQQIFLTYPQAESLSKEVLQNFFYNFKYTSRRNVEFTVERFLVAQERHEDGGMHFHAYLKLSGKPNITTNRLFDVDGHHPNIQGVRSSKNVLHYCKKDGDYISKEKRGNEWIDWEQSIKRSWGELVENASTKEEFLESVKQHYPRDFCLSYDRLVSMADQNFKPIREPFIPRYDRTSFREPGILTDWVTENLSSDQGIDFLLSIFIAITFILTSV